MAKDRDRSKDVISVDVKSGDVIVDNTDKYFSFYRLRCTESGTREYLQQDRSRGDGQQVPRYQV